MGEDMLTQVASGAWAMPVLFAMVFGDAFLVLLPGEVVVTAFGALAVAVGAPPLFAVIAVAGVAAFAGDACCYLVGRRVGLERWRWMRSPRATEAFAWARRRLERSTAVVVFTARFVPFARLAVNLTAGASRVRPVRYLPVAALAALGWAAYQAVVGAVIGMIVPGGPIVAVIVAIVIAVVLGVVIDLALRRRAE